MSLVINITDTDIAKVIKKLEKEDEIIISDHNKPVAIIKPFKKDIKKRKAGILKGKKYNMQNFFDGDKEIEKLFIG